MKIFKRYKQWQFRRKERAYKRMEEEKERIRSEIELTMLERELEEQRAEKRKFQNAHQPKKDSKNDSGWRNTLAQMGEGMTNISNSQAEQYTFGGMYGKEDTRKNRKKR